MRSHLNASLLAAVSLLALGVGSESFAADSLLFGKLPDDFVVYAIGTYGAPKPLDAQIDSSGHEARQADVIVNFTDKPIILVLTAYEPTVWRVGRTADTKISAIVVSGYHAQVLVGVDKGVPRAISSYENPGQFQSFYAYDASEKLIVMNRAVKRLVDREIDKFVNKPENGTFYIGDRPADANSVVYSNDSKLQDFVKQGRAPAGQRGIEALVKEGKIRPATRNEIEDWVDKASEKFKRFGNADLRVSHHMRVGWTYIILKPITLPDGMYGAHSRSFILPQGVSFPDGPLCHNEFYIMDGTRRGPGARADE